MAAQRPSKWMALHALLEKHDDRRAAMVIGQPFYLLFTGDQNAAIRRSQCIATDLQSKPDLTRKCVSTNVYAYAIRKMSSDAPLCEIAPLRQKGPPLTQFRLTFGYSCNPDPLMMGNARVVLVHYHFVADKGGAVFDAIDDLQRRRPEWAEEPPWFLEWSFFVALCAVVCVNPNAPLLPLTPLVELDELIAAIREIVPPSLVSVKPAKR